MLSYMNAPSAVRLDATVVPLIDKGSEVTSSILHLCARIDDHPLQQRKLKAACEDFSQWNDLLMLAEQHSMAPLLDKHLTAVNFDAPSAFVRRLRFLTIRHQRENQLRLQGLEYVLNLLAKEGLSCLVLKGAALCKTLYPVSGLRPMCDLDLYFAKDDVEKAHSTLQKKGCTVSEEQLPEDYYHLPPLCLVVEGFDVWIELHHDLFPELPPYYEHFSFAHCYANKVSFTLENGMTAYTFANEEMLWHLYQHGFHAPLTYAPMKLIAVADIVSLVEKNSETLDWDRISGVYPQLDNALRLFQLVTPWNDTLCEKLSCRYDLEPAGIGCSFSGWPRVSFAAIKGRSGLWTLLCDTFCPPQWWLMVYYSTRSRFALLRCRLLSHPLHILRWVKIHGRLLAAGKKRE